MKDPTRSFRVLRNGTPMFWPQSLDSAYDTVKRAMAQSPGAFIALETRDRINDAPWVRLGEWSADSDCAPFRVNEPPAERRLRPDGSEATR